ncbi:MULTISPECIES: hypothetical protein [unclassified Nonomuraea]|uniref:hypothetical protein n=1 Tax=unclassified Nonomuraea TaxID=2593643 RepID=UPI0033D3F9DF
MIGFAFLVVQGFALVFLVTAPGGLRRRVWQLLAAGAAVAVAAGWWLVAVALVQASERPYIGGSLEQRRRLPARQRPARAGRRRS